MKHIIIGGDGFVGRFIAKDLLARGETVTVCDIKQSPIPIYEKASFQHLDITDRAAVFDLDIQPDDIVYNVAARMLHPVVKRNERHEYFFSVDFDGARHVVDAMLARDCYQLIQFSTDMVYGKLQAPAPVDERHARDPIGEYSASKKAIEDYAIERRNDGLRVSVFRPRLIIGPGRLGVLGNLFRFIRHSLPVPMIGSGQNRYQMVSVYDCASAAIASADMGVVNGEFNLGSEEPPTVRALLSELIESARSRSVLIPVPALAIKSVLRLLDRMDLSVMVPEQYEVADDDYVVDISNTKQALAWAPSFRDTDMMLQAYDDFINGRSAATVI